MSGFDRSRWPSLTYDYKAKARNIADANNYMLAKTLSMFEYENLPETIPSRELERLLQTHGFAYVTEANDGKLYAFYGGIGGLPDAYGRPTQITIANPGLNFNKTCNLADDGVLIWSDDCMMGLLPLFAKYNTLLNENDINMVMYGFNSRMQTLISAGDDKTLASALAYLEKLVAGDLGVIGESALFDTLKTHASSNASGSPVTAMIEYQQYMKATLYNEIGLPANFNMKRERLSEAEVGLAEDALFPFVDNMMKCRINAIETINAKYGLDIKVGYGSVWHEKSKTIVDDIVEAELPEEAVSNASTETPTSDSLSLSPEQSSTGSSDAAEAEPEPEPSAEQEVTADEPSDEPAVEPSDEPTAESTDEQQPAVVVVVEPVAELVVVEAEAEPVVEVEPEAEAEDSPQQELDLEDEQVEQAKALLEESDLSEDDRQAIEELIDELRA